MERRDRAGKIDMNAMRRRRVRRSTNVLEMLQRCRMKRGMTLLQSQYFFRNCVIRKKSLTVQQNQGMTAHQPRRQHHPRSDARPRPLQWKEVGPSQPPLGLASINDELLESPRSVARSSGTPPQEPRCPGPGLLGDRFCAGFPLGQLPHESLRVARPPPSDFTFEDHELGLADVPSELWVRSHLLASSRQEGRSVFTNTPGMWQTITSHRRHPCGVDRQLTTVEQWEPISIPSSDCLGDTVATRSMSRTMTLVPTRAPLPPKSGCS